MGRRRNKKILRLRTKPKPRTPRGETRNWLELPRDVTVSILTRLRAVDIVQSAEKVCTAWRSICKDPLTWRTIDMRNEGPDEFFYDLDKMCRHLVDRSEGNLVDLNLECFASDALLKYIANRCGGIRRLRLAQCYGISEGLSDIASKLPLLEELEISLCNLSHKSLEAIGRSCPLLKSFKLNNLWYNWPEEDDNSPVNAVDLFGEEYFLDGGIDGYDDIDDEYHGVPPFFPCKDDDARAIAGTMRGLHHLQLFGNQLTEDGLKEILDSCPHLESLDLRYCLNLKMQGDLGKRCAERIKKLQLPYDPISDYEFPATVYGDGYSDGCEDYDEYGFGYGYQLDDSEWYDDFTKVRFSDQFSDEEEMRRTLYDDYIY